MVDSLHPFRQSFASEFARQPETRQFRLPLNERPQSQPGGCSEAESFSSVPEQRARRRPIEAQSAAIARAMARIGNDERASTGVMSGHDRKTLSLSAGAVHCPPISRTLPCGVSRSGFAIGRLATTSMRCVRSCATRANSRSRSSSGPSRRDRSGTLRCAVTGCPGCLPGQDAAGNVTGRPNSTRACASRPPPAGIRSGSPAPGSSSPSDSRPGRSSPRSSPRNR